MSHFSWLTLGFFLGLIGLGLIGWLKSGRHDGWQLPGACGVLGCSRAAVADTLLGLADLPDSLIRIEGMAIKRSLLTQEQIDQLPVGANWQIDEVPREFWGKIPGLQRLHHGERQRKQSRAVEWYHERRGHRCSRERAESDGK
jgi:hypothetical protein